ncbi:hypothetical protein E1162_16325 [Rhodobacteraceae bacterium RKSG542]|uniref:hypothetical protein n=1 Tax=Pseudovibrio flavus TaxID=2529854 RepID=UPI0012BC83CC|nr:hypothetical protein [Pseudovibrio flavus]MTI18814.1 hypothetical protein [Pseudovibrio flavus]
MKAFSALVEALESDKSPTARERYLAAFLAENDRSECEVALGVLSGAFSLLKAVRPKLLEAVSSKRLDAEYAALSKSFLKDQRETIALNWPVTSFDDGLSLSDAWQRWQTAAKGDQEAALEALLDECAPQARLVLIKLLSGSLSGLIAPRDVWAALFRYSGKGISEIAWNWHFLNGDLAAMFSWLEDKAALEMESDHAGFVQASQWVEGEARAILTAGSERDFLHCEPLPEGVDLVISISANGRCRIYTEEGSEVTAAFDEMAGVLRGEAVIFARLSLERDGHAVVASDLLKLLSKKKVELLSQGEVTITLLDRLLPPVGDLHHQPFLQRRQFLTGWQEQQTPEWRQFLVCSPIRSGEDATHSAKGNSLNRLALWAEEPDTNGDLTEVRYTLKPAPLLLVGQVMHVSFMGALNAGREVEITIGLWHQVEGEQTALMPVAKASYRPEKEIAAQLAAYVKAQSVGRFGPLRELHQKPDHLLAARISYTGAAKAPRRKSGLQLHDVLLEELFFSIEALDAPNLNDLHSTLF